MDFSTFTDRQAECVRLLDGPLLVCAGAGSGKTFMLTRRVAWALSSGSGADGAPFLDSIDQALIITYTSKAAIELKDRIRSTLRSEGMVSEALKADGAWISTIHGMCDRILREHALELDIDPSFQIVMEGDAKAARMEAVDAVVRTMSDQHLIDGYEALLAEYGADGTAALLLGVLGEASHLTAGLDAFQLGPAPANPRALAREVVEALEAVQEDCSEGNAEKCRGALDSLEALLADPEVDAAKLSKLLGGIKLNSQTKKPAVGEAIALIKSHTLSLSLAAAYPLAGALLDLARAVDGEYNRLLRSRGLMDISEVIRFTLRAFHDNPQMAKTYTDRFKLIMVDEFQDTSQLQIDMIECIAGSSKHHLCTVGDSQQSIYRFQGADVNVYLRHKQDMQSPAVGAHLVKLEDNFRSHGDVLAFVRRICGQRDFFIEDFLDLQHGRNEQKLIDRGAAYRGSAPRIEALLTTFPYHKERFALKAEAEHIAQRFAQLRDDGHTASQMVLLLGAMTHADIFADAFRAQGFSCVITGGSGFFKTEEAKLCQCLLAALANPLDVENLFSVLASDILPVSSDDLLRISTRFDDTNNVLVRQNIGRGMYIPEQIPEERSPLLDHALAVFTRAWRKLGHMRPSRIFLETVSDAGWLQRLQAGGPQGQAEAANVLKFARLMADAEARTGFDITSVSKFMAASFNDSGTKPGALSVEDSDAVRIMTIHSSKGLEFPIVAIADCWEVKAKAPGEKSAGDRCIMVADGGTEYLSLRQKEGMAPPACEHPVTAINPRTSQSDYRAQLMQMNYDRDYAERRRLLYVAITRASEALILSARRQVNQSSEELLADVAAGIFPAEPDFPAESCLVEYGGSEPMAFTRIDATAPESADEADAQDEEAAAPEPARIFPIPELPPEERMRLVPLSAGSDFFSYSSIAPKDSHGPVLAFEPDDAERAPARPVDADKATDFGSALHRACEWLALQPQSPDEAMVQTALERIGRAYAIKDTVRLADAFSRWRASDLCARALAFAYHQPEVPFCTCVAHEYLEGEIDLLCSDDPAPAGGHAFIVDYKTGGSDAENADALAEKHLLQAQCYAFAAMKSGFESVELHFVRVERDDAEHPGQPQIVDYRFGISDLDALEQTISSARI